MQWFLPHVKGEFGLSAFARLTAGRSFDMKRKPNPELIDQENPEWTDEDFRHARPASEVLPELLGPQVASEMLKPRGRPKGAATKTHVNIRLDDDLLQAFKSKGRGWQTRINSALREWLNGQDESRRA
jgi:uncharacterized protein (DUF4415 family)